MSADDLYLFNTQQINLPRKSRRSSILKTIEGNLAKDDRISRRVSFANNLFLQELKPDGTTQLLTEPFKNNLSDDKVQQNDQPQDESVEQQVPVMRSDKRRKSSKNFKNYISQHYNINDQDDYETIFNTSVNRNAKRKYEDDNETRVNGYEKDDKLQRMDINTLFDDTDSVSQEGKLSKFMSGNAGFSNPATMSIPKSNDISCKIVKIPKGFTASVTTNNNSSNMELTNLESSSVENSDMELTNLDEGKNDESANFMFSNCTPIVFSTTTNKNPERKFGNDRLIEDPALRTEDDKAQSIGISAPFCGNIDSNGLANLDKENQPFNLTFNNTGFLTATTYMNSTAANDSIYKAMNVPKGFTTSVNTNNNSSNMELTNLENSNQETDLEVTSSSNMELTNLTSLNEPSSFAFSNIGLLSTTYTNSATTLNDSICKAKQMPNLFATSVNTNNNSSNMQLTNLDDSNSEKACTSSATLNDSNCKIKEATKGFPAASVNTNNNSSNMELTLKSSNLEKAYANSATILDDSNCKTNEEPKEFITPVKGFNTPVKRFITPMKANSNSSNMELTNLENSNQETSDMELTNLECSNLEANDMELTNLENSNQETIRRQQTTVEHSKQDGKDMELTNLDKSYQATNKESTNLESSNQEINDMELTNLEKSKQFTTPVSSRRFSPRKSCSKLSTSSVKFKPCSGRRFTMSSNAWAINKNKLHSTVNFKNNSLFNYRDNQTLELDSQLETRNGNSNKTLPINLKFEEFNDNEAQSADDCVVKSKDVCESTVSSTQDDKPVDTPLKLDVQAVNKDRSIGVCESTKSSAPAEERSNEICKSDGTFSHSKSNAPINNDVFESSKNMNIESDGKETHDNVHESSKMDLQTDEMLKLTDDFHESANLTVQTNEKDKPIDVNESVQVNTQSDNVEKSFSSCESLKVHPNESAKSSDVFEAPTKSVPYVDENEESNELFSSKQDAQTDSSSKKSVDTFEPFKMDLQADEIVKPVSGTFDSSDMVLQADAKEKSIDIFESSKQDVQAYEKENSVDNCEPVKMDVQTDEMAKSNDICESSNMSIDADEKEKSISVREFSKSDNQDYVNEKSIDNDESFKVNATSDETTKSTIDICEPAKISMQVDEKSNYASEFSKSELDQNNKTVDEMLNQIQLNYSIKVKELKNKSQLPNEFESTHGNLSTIIEPSNSQLEQIKSPTPTKKVYNNKTFTLDKFNFSSKDQTPTREHLKSTFTISNNRSINNHLDHHLQSTFTVNPIDNKSITNVKPKPAATNRTFTVQEDNINEIVGQSVMSIINKTIDRLNEENTKDLSETMEICEDENKEEKKESLIQDQLLIPEERMERRSSLYKNLSNLERELNKETINDSILVFQTQTIYENMDSSKSISNDNNTTYQINELRNQIDMVNNLMSEKSFSTKYINDAIMKGGDEKIKNYFLQQNKSLINFKSFNGHVALYLDLEARCETEYSDIKDMNLILDFDKPILKFWEDKFYLFYYDKPEHKNLIDILKCLLDKQFNDLKAQLLKKYPTTEFQVNIKEEVELMLNRVSDFVKDIKITTLKFINYEFKFKQDNTFDFCINLFGVNRRFMVVLNISFSGDFPIRPRFNCWLEDKNYYPFDDIKTIVEESSREGSSRINKTIIRVNRFLKKLRKLYLEEMVRNALQNWNV